MQGRPADDVRHEDVFVGHYDTLRQWALGLVDNNHADADDLVQNAFVSFVRQRPLLRTITNLDGYLYGLLRNLRRYQLRAKARRQHHALDLLEYESLAEGLRAHRTAAERDAKELLAVICDYACRRKARSKAGSVLLLRWFQGYYPTEIALIGRMPVGTVWFSLNSARREARLFIQNAGQFDSDQTGIVWPALVDAETVDDVIRALRVAIQRTRSGPCFEPAQWRTLYDDNDGTSLSVERLAHLASCAPCLRVVSDHLGLDSYDSRHPTDTLGNDPSARRHGTTRANNVRAADRESGRQARRAPFKRSIVRTGSVLENATSWWRRVWDTVSPTGFPARIAAATCAAIALTLATWQLTPSQRTNASVATVLGEVRAVETQNAHSADVAFHRVLTLEERRLPDQRVTRRRRVEVWESATRHVVVKRQFDEDGTLLAGEWIAADGRRTLYDRNQQPVYEPSAAVMPLTSDAMWRWDPSGTHFEMLASNLANATLEERPDTYVIRFAATEPLAEGDVVETALTVSKTQKRAIDQRLVVKGTNALHEYRYKEVAYERIPESRAPAHAFAPESELTPPARSVAPMGVPRAPAAAPVRRALPNATLDALELEVGFNLHRLETCLVSTPHVTRTGNRLQLEAAVAGTECGRRAAAAFADLPNNLLRVSVQAADDSSADSGVFAEPIAAPDRTASVQGGASSAELQLVASRLALAESHALAVQQITRSWPTNRLERLDSKHRLMWQAMLREHAGRVDQEFSWLASHILAVSGDKGVRSESEHVRLSSAAQAGALADHLVAIVRAAERHYGASGSEDVRLLGRATDEAMRTARAFLEPWPVDVGPADNAGRR